MDLPAGCLAVGPRERPTSPGSRGHRTVGTPDPVHCAQRGATDTSHGKEPGCGGKAGCGRVAALGLVLAPTPCPWPRSCSARWAQRRRSVWAAGPASAVLVWDASHLADALEGIPGGPCRPHQSHGDRPRFMCSLASLLCSFSHQIQVTVGKGGAAPAPGTGSAVPPASRGFQRQTLLPRRKD